MDSSQVRALEPVLRLGVSSCLLGHTVRYDGGHKLDRYLADTLGQFVEWVPVCPEVEMRPPGAAGGDAPGRRLRLAPPGDA